MILENNPKTKGELKNEDDFKNADYIGHEDDLKNEDKFKNGDNFKIKATPQKNDETYNNERKEQVFARNN